VPGHGTGTPRPHPASRQAGAAAFEDIREKTMKIWTEEEIRQLGATTDLVTAGQILGIGRTKSYSLARRNAFPVPVLRTGHRYTVPVRHILTLLGIGKDFQDGA
jgi:hypothetical protein